MRYARMAMCLFLVGIMTVGTIALAGPYERTYNADSYHIYTTLNKKKTSKDCITNENDTCRRTSDNAKTGFYTNAWSSGDKRATDTGWANHGETSKPKYKKGFGAIDASYKLEMGNPNSYKVRMVGTWTPN